MHFLANLLPLLTLALTTQYANGTPLQRSTGPTCKTFKVPITANAQNQIINLPANTNLSAGIGPILNAGLSQLETGLGNLLGSLTGVSGTYEINMKYCTPEKVVASRAKTVQVSGVFCAMERQRMRGHETLILPNGRPFSISSYSLPF